MRQWLPLYEGDGYLRDPGPYAAGAEDLTKTVGEHAAVGVPSGPEALELERKARQLRAETLRSWFPKAAAWARDKIHHARMCEAERYLSQATDLADLERRLHEAERRGMHSLGG
jgi:hypothetical protein